MDSVNLTVQNSTTPECAGDKIVIGSIAFFAAGCVFFLATFIYWIVKFCQARRRRAIGARYWSKGSQSRPLQVKEQPLPLKPPVSTMDVQASGAYLGLQESVDMYESIQVTPDVTPAHMPRYIPRDDIHETSRDAMHETFDGSRMPSKKAPKPPNFPPQNKDNDRKFSFNTGQENEAEYITPDDINSVSDEDDTDSELSYETPESSKPVTNKPPTIPARRPKKK